VSPFQDLLAREFAPYGELTPEQLASLEGHHKLLTQWNARLNLTRIRSLLDSVQLHYCESLFLGRALPAGSLKIADIGSGAGFPGIPIGILRPECSVTLVESHQRKAVFLQEAVRGLKNIKVASSRAEDLREQYDWLVSRAVASKDILALSLAPSRALLVGEGEFSDAQPMPWGNGRFLAFVPRGTSNR
jgi:16S rRNA (guanine(527)-N(7))-methyltransferase RsmG